MEVQILSGALGTYPVPSRKRKIPVTVSSQGPVPQWLEDSPEKRTDNGSIPFRTAVYGVEDSRAEPVRPAREDVFSRMIFRMSGGSEGLRGSYSLASPAHHALRGGLRERPNRLPFPGSDMHSTHTYPNAQHVRGFESHNLHAAA